MSNYTKATNFASKDSLSSGNPAKIIKGTEINTEFDAISTAVATKADKTYVDDLLSTAGTGSVSSVGSGTGLTGGPITTTGTLAIANTGVTAGTYGQAGVSYPILTINAQGQITAASVSTSFGSGGSSGVTSFNSRTGAVSLTGTDVTNALGYSPASTSGGNTWSGVQTFTNYTLSQYYNFTNTSSIYYYSGTGEVNIDNSSTTIAAFGTGRVWIGQRLDTKQVVPSADNTYSMGSSGSRWTVIYAATGTINTSDANYKTDIADLDAAEKRVATRIKGLIKKFKFKDAVAEKGSAARIHVGVIAQDVFAAFQAEGLDANKYGLFCEDTWSTESAEYDRHGNEMKPAVAGGRRLGVRYEELLAFVIAAL